jgi:hypothetical protein
VPPDCFTVPNGDAVLRNSCFPDIVSVPPLIVRLPVPVILMSLMFIVPLEIIGYVVRPVGMIALSVAAGAVPPQLEATFQSELVLPVQVLFAAIGLSNDKRNMRTIINFGPQSNIVRICLIIILSLVNPIIAEEYNFIFLQVKISSIEVV